MSQIDELLANNEAYAAAFDKGELPLPPGEEARGRRVHGRAAEPVRRARAAARATRT